MKETLRDFKDKRYKFVKDNIHNHKVKPSNVWL